MQPCLVYFYLEMIEFFKYFEGFPIDKVLRRQQKLAYFMKFICLGDCAAFPGLCMLRTLAGMNLMKLLNKRRRSVLSWKSSHRFSQALRAHPHSRKSSHYLPLLLSFFLRSAHAHSSDRLQRCICIRNF